MDDTVRINRLFSGRNEKRIGEERERHASVLIPLLQEADGSLSVLFQVRSSKLPEQPGDICFPGGMAEPGETAAETAVRETREELLLDPGQIELIGPSDVLQNAKLMIHPFAGWIHDYRRTFSRDEVQEIFTVPLDFLLETEPRCYEMEWKPELPDDFPFEKICGGRRYAWRERKDTVYFYEYDSYVIWGMTAEMLHAFLGILKEGRTG